jgi:type III pantothenate kinase
MNASIDIGNTFAKIGFFEDDILVEVQKGLKINDLEEIVRLKNVKNLIISSVTRSFEELEEIFKGFVGNQMILTSQTPVPIIKKYDTPETLGADRLAGAVGANFLFPNTTCLIIDMGTALKYDFITKEKKFEGGIISLGMRIRFEALHTFTKKLPLLGAEGLPDLVGTNTKTCIQSGVINGMIAEINGIIEKYYEKGVQQVILCGGDAQFFESQIKIPNFAPQLKFVPHLVLIGLNRILQYNVEKK